MSGYRRGAMGLGAIVLVLLSAVRAWADGTDPDQEARGFAEAHARGEDPAAAAARVTADPWLVADALIARPDPAAAQAFAAARAEDPAHQGLPAWVAASLAGPAIPPSVRAAVARARALLLGGSPEAAILALEAVSAPPSSVVGIEREWWLARALEAHGRPAPAAVAAMACAEHASAVGWVRRAAEAFRRAGIAFGSAYDPVSARHAHERRLALLRAVGTEDGIARALNDAGVAARDASDFPGAIRLLEEALALRERIGPTIETAEVLTNLAVPESERGRFGRALALVDRAAQLLAAAADAPAATGPDGAAATLRHRRALAAAWVDEGRGAVALLCGAIPLASSSLRAALAAARDVRGVDEGARDAYTELEAYALGNLAIVHAKEGDAAAAERVYLESLRLFERQHDTPRIAQTFANLADLLSEAGKHDEAIAFQERALARITETGDPLSAARTRGSIGTLRRRAGQPRRALEDHEAARAQAAALGATFVEAEQWVGLAAAHLDLHEDAAAVDAAEHAFAVFRTFAFGAGDAVGISLQEAYDEMFEVGALAAARLGDAPRTARLLEAGRGAQLITALGGRDALAVVAVPPELVAQERTARAAETQALAAWLEHVRAGTRDAAGRAAWLAARDAAAAVVERIQREQATAANLAYPEPVAPAEVARRLAPADAFVWYGVFPRGVVAVVARPKGLRLVRLKATADAIEAAVEPLVEGGGEGATPEALAALRRIVVDDLALEPAVRRVFVSPAGALAYAPLGALFADRVTVLAPSATALGLLAGTPTTAGQRVLALGDPVYDAATGDSAVQAMRGALSLSPLPATREEAVAVADGLPPLLGRDATERALRTAVAGTNGRLRAVHLACHGLVDRDQPLHSSLALTAEGTDDGYLTGAEILRMHLETDLVVLSACRSGLGRVARGEGMLGLSRAFMFAGAPRVIASLWKVDDDATKALMVRFYALWNPKDRAKALPSAEALRQAQAYVREQPRWAHPRYWAAWVLWGAAD